MLHLKLQLEYGDHNHLSILFQSQHYFLLRNLLLLTKMLAKRLRLDLRVLKAFW